MTWMMNAVTVVTAFCVDFDKNAGVCARNRCALHNSGGFQGVLLGSEFVKMKAVIKSMR